MFGNGGYSSALPYAGDGRACERRLRRRRDRYRAQRRHSRTSPATNPEAIIDWGWRAVHTSIVNAKRVVAEFYGRNASFSYFQGCSTGGHQALMEAQRFPEDFNGIIAGAPGNNRTHLERGFPVAVRAEPGTRWRASPDRSGEQAAHAQQSLSRGVQKTERRRMRADSPSDPFLNDPMSCSVDPAALLCGGAETDECLTLSASRGRETDVRRRGESAHRRADLLRLACRKRSGLEPVLGRSAESRRAGARGFLALLGIQRSAVELATLRLRRRHEARRRSAAPAPSTR